MEFSGRVGRHTSGLWGKYRRGEVVPRQGRSSNGRLNIIEQVEASYPGTADWFRWPLWRLLDPAPLGMEEIRGYYQDRTIFPHDVAVMVLLERPERGFWREDFEVGEVCYQLLTHGFGGLCGILTLIREAKIVQDRYQYAIGVESLLRFATDAKSHWPYFGPRHRRRMTQLLTSRWQRLSNPV